VSDVLLIQNAKVEGSGTLGNLLQSNGLKIKSVFAKQEKLPKEDFL